MSDKKKTKKKQKTNWPCDKIAYENSADPDQTITEGESELELHCFPFQQVFDETSKIYAKKKKKKNDGMM